MRHLFIFAVASTLMTIAASAEMESKTEDPAAAAASELIKREAEEEELKEHLNTMVTSQGRDRALIGYAIPTVLLVLGGIGYAWIFSNRKQA